MSHHVIWKASSGDRAPWCLMIIIGPVHLGRQVGGPLGISSNTYLKRNQFPDLFYVPHRLSRIPKVARAAQPSLQLGAPRK